MKKVAVLIKVFVHLLLMLEFESIGTENLTLESS